MTVDVDDPQSHELRLLQATPNPSRRDVSIQFALPRPGDIDIGIHDLVGRRVRRLQASLPAGAHRLIWDGRDDSGRRAAPGVYTVRARSGALSSTTRLVRLH